MTTEQPIVGGEENDSHESKEPNAELRAHNKRLVDKVTRLEAQDVDRQLAAIDLNRDSGMGKAIVNTFDGDVEPGAIAAFAQSEYGVEPAQVPVTQEVQAQDRLDQAMQGSTSVEPLVAPPKGQEAIDKMNANDPEAGREVALDSIAAKSVLFNEKFYPET